MIIKNISQGTTISNNAKQLTSFSDRLLGLLNPKNPHFLLIDTRFGIHTFFIKMPIDLIILDKDQKIVQLVENLSPNKFFFYNPKYKTVIEMPMNTIEKHGLKERDEISYK